MKVLVRNILLLLFFAGKIFSQNDSVQTIKSDSVIYNNDFSLKEGVYLSYSDFRKNNPLPKENIISNDDKTQLDFIAKTIKDNKQFTFRLNGTTFKAETNKVWGYCQNNTIYINFQKNFYRVPVFGNISHFFGTVEVINYVNNYNGGYYGGYGMGMGMGGMGMGGPTTAVKQKEQRQFIFEFYTGDIVECTATNIESALSRDLKLYEAYMKLKKKQRKEMMILYIRKYNEAHPIYFPVPKN